MISIERAFNVGPNGLSLDDEVGIFSISDENDPRLVDSDAPTGSIFLGRDGSLWQKTGETITNWVMISNTEGAVTSSSNRNIDGGRANEIYTPDQFIDCGGANG
jgi:hypothetical protein